jgi:hypothetical protein
LRAKNRSGSRVLIVGNIDRELPKSDRIYSDLSRDVSRIGAGNNGNFARTLSGDARNNPTRVILVGTTGIVVLKSTAFWSPGRALGKVSGLA